MNEFTKTIVEWYEENKRELPWRESADPYLIWISEIILQQTRVAQGYDYFLRFIKRFPDVQTLAAADEDEVMKYWQGLGYYSRARNLHAAAVYSPTPFRASTSGYVFVCLRYALCGGGWQCVSGAFTLFRYRYSD